ncbi:hypothetical protein [Vitiosangium sp. GDMCC 1.1324]|uniref:hypothetical protein n=1 Tax=Vitiosangium sp. (strain GDMCC 1.1324) TaxID=2138576 RepID=UPI000D3C07E5|nr:hypothetical protein [Vitiosangium sp. GDMCC 1.1324]PTL84041.1 hypothetical protein DAT35_11345 [Vitiosangium sp. GDMCC 1.1324]
MAKRTRIIEGTWNCTSCDTRDIPARHRSCPSCNNPREETGKESEFEFGGVDAASGKSLREGVTDEKALSAAAAGVDWFCDYCGASNRGNAPQCRNCRAQRADTSRTLSEDPEPADAPPPPPPAPKRSRRKWLFVGLGVFSLFATCVIWGSRSHNVTGQVTSTEWTRTVHRETFQRVSKTGWRDELRATPPRMPVNGQGEVAGVENIRNCVTRQRGTRQVADGTEHVCETKSRRVQCGTEEKCTRKKMGNGFMKEECNDVPKYCNESYEDCRDRTRYRTEPVFDLSCTYDTYAWTEVDRRQESGRDSAPRWPQLSTGSLDRLRREEKYVVRIGYTDDGAKEHQLEPKNESEFLSWKMGQSVPLQVSNFGSVTVLAGDVKR